MRRSSPRSLKTRGAGVDAVKMEPATDPAQAELHDAYQRYRAAMTSWRAAAKAGHAGTTEAAADGLLQARVVLYRALIGTGWSPPAGVRVQIERDAVLIEMPQDFEALLTV